MTETKKASIKELRPDDKNINQSSARGGEMLRRSLQEYGAARSLVADKNMRIVAGNQTLEAAAAIGLDDVVVVPTDGSKLVVVQRTDIDLDTPRGRELAIADNRTNQVGYNPDPLMLAWHGSNGADLDKFWLPDELAALDLPDVDGLDLGEDDDEPIGDADAVPEVEDAPTSKRGDLWILGEHRVLCGDSTSAEDVARLMDGEMIDICVTSPPYNSGDGGYKTDYKGKEKSFYIESVDKRTEAEHVAFCVSVLNLISANLRTELSPVVWNVMYTAKARSSYGDHIFSKEHPLTVKETICWDKRGGFPTASGGILSRNWELVFVLSKGDKYFTTQGQNEVRWAKWEISAGTQHDIHKATFPIDFARKALCDFSREGHVLFEPFLGSGTCLIACEETKRRCFGLEMIPQYVDVIVKRWQDYTGKEAKHEDGRTFAEVSQTRLANTEES